MVKAEMLRGEKTNELCPWCAVGLVYVRTYMTVHSNPGTGIKFACCDNDNCNVEWFADETETYWRVIDRLSSKGKLIFTDELVAARLGAKRGEKVSLVRAKEG